MSNPSGFVAAIADSVGGSGAARSGNSFEKGVAASSESQPEAAPEISFFPAFLPWNDNKKSWPNQLLVEWEQGIAPYVWQPRTECSIAGWVLVNTAAE
jgi:hypothetical protein